MKDVMIDLETLGTESDCPVLSLGAVLFDPKTGELGDRAYYVLDVQEQLDKGRRMSFDTFCWWLRQGEEARSAISTEQTRLSTGWALTDFFSRLPKGVRPWSNGAGFDIVIVESLAKAYGVPVPWKYWDIRDTRTLWDVTGVRPNRGSGTHHIAVDDAVAQAQAVVAAYAKLT